MLKTFSPKGFYAWEHLSHPKGFTPLLSTYLYLGEDSSFLTIIVEASIFKTNHGVISPLVYVKAK